MAYTKFYDPANDNDPITPIKAEAWNHVETGVFDAAADADTATTAAAAAQATADAAISKAILDAAGDLLSASAADTPARLALGSNDEVLSVNTGALDYRKVVNAMVDAAAAIDYAKLNLTNAIVNADIDDAAAIAYAKLNLAASIVNADIASAAAIAYSKLNLASSIVNADISGSAAIDYSKLNLTNNIVNADIDDAAAIAYSKLNLASSVTSSDISNGTIVDEDINASAAVALSKLAQTAWSSYTPVLTADASNPVLGTGGAATGASQRVGNLVTGRVAITFGTSGTNAGSGNYEITVPVNIAVGSEVCGHGYIFDASTVTVKLVIVTRNSATEVDMVYDGGLFVTNALPFAWAASDSINLFLNYEAA